MKIRHWWNRWDSSTLPDEEKTKLKNLSPDEINEMLIAEQERLQEAEKERQVQEAVEFFERIYPEILHGNFKMDGKRKRFTIEGNIGMPEEIESGKVLQVMFVEKGYMLVDAKPDRWEFGMVRDFAHETEGYFSGVHYIRGLSRKYWE